MIKDITIYNARTQSIELAVSELSKRESITMTDVREYMDTLVSNKIKTGKKATYVDPNGEEHEYEVKAPISKYYNYVKDEKEIYSRILQNIENNRKFFCNIKKDVKLSDMLRELKYNASFVARDDIASFVEWAINVGKDIQYTCEHGDVNKDIDWKKLNLVFDSTQMGCGKSYFEMSLMRGARSLGIKVPEQDYETQLPKGGFENHLEESQNLIVVHQERRGQKVDLDTLKQIARREMYPYTEKGKMQIRIPGRAIMLGSTNGFDYTSQDPRGFRTIHCLPYTWQEISRISRKFPENSNFVTRYITKIYQVNYEFSWFSRFLDKLVDKENLNINENDSDGRIQKTMKLREYDMSYLLLDILESITSERELLYSISTSGLAKLYKRYSAKELTYNQCNAIATLLQQLFRAGLVRKCNYESRDLYVKYDLSGIMDIRVSDLSEQLDLTPEREIQDAFDEWDRIIKMAEDFENDPNNKFLKGSDEKLDDSWTICGKYDKEGEYNANGDQVCVNKPLEGEPKNRTNRRVHQQNFLFECDDIPVKQQVEQIENAPQELKDSLLWTCFTGGKSIHAVVHTNLKDEDLWTEKGEYDAELRKYVHQKLSERYFGGHADKSGQNASRLARAPNAIRQDEKHPGAKQLCLQFNMDAKPLDVSDLVEDYKEEKRLSRTLKELIGRPPIPEECRKEPSVHTLAELKEWNMKAPSKAKQECIQFLEGTLEDWNRSIACVRELRNFGFDDCEIESEGPYNDKWIKEALKAAH